MSQFSRRKVLRAAVGYFALVAASTPVDVAAGFSRHIKEDPDWRIKRRLSAFIGSTYKQPGDLVRRIVDSAFTNAVSFDVPALLILAIVAKESSFAPDAVSSYGAVGLMQVVPRLHRDAVAAVASTGALTSPEANIKAGTQILRKHLRSTRGNVVLALRNYSGGAHNYVQQIDRHWQTFIDVGNRPQLA